MTASSSTTVARRLASGLILAAAIVPCAACSSPPREVTPGIYVAGDARLVIGENGQFVGLDVNRAVVDGVDAATVSVRGTWEPGPAQGERASLRLTVDPAATATPLTATAVLVRVDADDEISLAAPGRDGERYQLTLTDPGDIHTNISLDPQPLASAVPALPPATAVVWQADVEGPRDLLPAPDHHLQAVVWLSPADVDGLLDGCEPQAVSSNGGGEPLAGLVPAGDLVRCDALNERLSTDWHVSAAVHPQAGVLTFSAWR